MTDVAEMTKPEVATPTVRVATVEDLDAVMALCLAAVDDNGFLGATPEKLLHAIYPTLLQDGGIIGVTEEPDGGLSGGVLLTVGSHWYSDDKFLEEKSIFISKEYRAAKGGRASKLIEFAKHAADMLGLPLLIGVLSNERTEAKVKLYVRKFGAPTGAFFLYGSTTGVKDRSVSAEGVGG